MRCVFIALIMLIQLGPVAAATPRPSELTSRDAVLGFIWSYRAKPTPAAMPGAIRAASQVGVFRDPESAGVFVGFIAGVIVANPAEAERMISKALPLPAEDQWAIVRAVAYSGTPGWQSLLRKLAPRLPARKAMIELYLQGKLPTLEHFALSTDRPLLERLWDYARVDKYFSEPEEKPPVLQPSPDLIDTFWGYHFATGAYSPIARIIELLPWSKQRDDVERLTIGSMAKYTLAINAARDPRLLELLHWAARQQHSAEALPVLREVIAAAEAVDVARVRKEAVAAIEELKRKGPGYRRKVAWWGLLGETAIAGGCLAAAIAGQVQLGIPCVVGGAVSSAGLRLWAAPD